jgi:hypothetical protein
MKTNKYLRSIIFLILGLLILGGCSSADSLDKYPSATEIADIVGIWSSDEGSYHYFGEDGLHYFAHSIEKLEERLASDRPPEGEFWFEGNHHYHTSRVCAVNGIEDPGVYEIKMIEEDVIKFVPIIEDECFKRENWLAGYEIYRDEHTWTRIP